MGEALDKCLEIGQGMQTGANSVFGKLTKFDIDQMGLPERLYRKRMTNTDIQRYSIIDRGEYLLYLENEKSFASLPNKLQNYLNKNKEKLTERAACVRENCLWWQYTWPLHKTKYVKPRIISPYLADENRFAMVEDDTYIGLTDTTVLFESGQVEDLRYFLAILNSRIIQARFLAMAKLKSAGIYEYFWNSISRLRIKRINFKIVAEKRAHDRLVALTKEIENTIRGMNKAKLESDLKAKKQRLNSLENELESIVAVLYGLNAEDVSLIKEK